MCDLNQMSLYGIKACFRRNHSLNFEHFDKPSSSSYLGNICFSMKNLDKSGKEEFWCQRSSISTDQLWLLFYIQTEEIRWRNRPWNTITKITDVLASPECYRPRAQSWSWENLKVHKCCCCKNSNYKCKICLAKGTPAFRGLGKVNPTFCRLLYL